MSSWILDILDVIGYYGPSLLILENLWFMKYRIFHMALFIVYVFIAILITKQLKLWIRDTRPHDNNNTTAIHPYEWMSSMKYEGAEKYGMPSGHSTLIFFSLGYLWQMKQNVPAILSGSFVGFLTLIQRYKYGKHNIMQLAAGALLGISLAYVAYRITTRFFSKQ